MFTFKKRCDILRLKQFYIILYRRNEYAETSFI